MKCTINGKLLGNILQRLIGITKRKSTFTVLKNCLINAENDVLSVYATDLDIAAYIETKDCEIREDGFVLVNAELLSKTVLNAEDVELLTTNGSLVVSVGKKKARLPMADITDYPDKYKKVSVEKSVHINASDLKRLLSSTSYAISRFYDAGKSEFTGELLLIENNKLSVRATDGHRLSMGTLPSTDCSIEQLREGVIIPLNGVKQLLLLTGDSIELGMFNGKLYASSDDGYVLINPISGSFPDFSKVIPERFNTSFIIDKAESKKIFNDARTFSPDSNVIRIDVDAESMTVSSSSSSGELTQCEDVVEFNGKSNFIGMNVLYLNDMLNVSSERVRVQVEDSDAPVLFTDPDDSSIKHIIMPMELD